MFSMDYIKNAFSDHKDLEEVKQELLRSVLTVNKGKICKRSDRSDITNHEKKSLKGVVFFSDKAMPRGKRDEDPSSPERKIVIGET